MTASSSVETGHARLLAAGFVFLCAFAVVAGRLLDLSMADTDRSGPGLGSPVVGTSARGAITDRNGVLLATNMPVKSAFVRPSLIRDPAEVARRIAGVLGSDAGEIEQRLRSDSDFVYVRRLLTPNQYAALSELEIPGLDFEDEAGRFYPQGALTSHLVGFTNVDTTGIAGVEKQFDEALAAGTGIALALDIRVQHLVRTALARAIDRFNAVGGTGVVLDVDSGEVVAMVSLPDFHPLDAGTAPADHKKNNVAQSIYELGSTFKIFTAAATLESGRATLQTPYDARQPLRVGGHRVSDYRPQQRWMTLAEGFMRSSNIVTGLMALDLGPAGQQEFMCRLGFFEEVPIELPERAAPLLPSKWDVVDAVPVAFGHTLASTPLHLARAVAAMVNGGRLPPVTVLHREHPGLAGAGPAPAPAGGTRPCGTGEQVISSKTSHDINRLLRLAVVGGTGRKGNADGYVVGGKTGTAEKVIDGRYSRERRIASFVGAFPMTRPRYVVSVTVDEPKGRKETFGFATGGWVAAPVVREIIARSAFMLGIDPVDETVPAVSEALHIPIPEPEEIQPVRAQRVAFRSRQG